MTEHDLLKKKKEIEVKKEELLELQGEEKSLLKRLKDEYGCGTLKSGIKKVKEMEEEEAELLNQIEKLTEQLENKYYSDEDYD